MSSVRTLRVGEYTTLTELSDWVGSGALPLLIQITRSSSFSPSVEGVALGILGQLASNNCELNIDCLHEIDLNTHLGLFESIFGVALVSIAQTVRTPSSVDVRAALMKTLWSRVRGDRGQFGDGTRKYIISRDPDNPVPSIFSMGNQFPMRDRFRLCLAAVTRAIVGPRKTGYSPSAEEDAMTFLYEATRNAYEHARAILHPSGLGIRGLIFEKMAFRPSENPYARRDLLALQRDYLARARDVSASGLVLAYTVADIGPGIHNTLPSNPGEASWDRLCRAFLPGQSRKLRGTDVEAGQGLPKLCFAAERLKAWLLVRSADQVGYADFSVARLSGEPFLKPWPEPVHLGTVGTSLTMMWPVVFGRERQTSLFSRDEESSDD